MARPFPLRAAPWIRVRSRSTALLASILLLAGLMALLRAHGGSIRIDGSPVGATSVALGFLLLAAYLAGSFAAEARLPRITGYILVGALVGPEVARLVDESDVARLRALDEIAISLIALSAGGELRLTELRRRGRMLVGIMASEMTAVFVAVGGFILLASALLPIPHDTTWLEIAILAMVFGSIAIANSPSVAIAVINDAKASGPVTSTILSVTILKDVVVIVFFALALSIGRSVLGGAGGGSDFLVDVALAIPGSLVVGAVVGWLVSLYLRHLRSQLVLFTLAVAFVNAQLAAALHLEVLLVSLSAGFFVENISPVEGEPFIRAIEKNSMPLYALFFGLAGAALHLSGLIELGLVVIALVAVRAAAIFVGTWAGARLVGAEDEIRRHAWVGFISQAGVTLGMVVIAARAFPQWAGLFTTVFVAMVALHELTGPILMQEGLRRSGEIGRAPSSRRPAEARG